MRRLVARLRAPFGDRVGPGIAFGAIRLALDAGREVKESQRKASERAS